jgi:integrase
MNELRSDFDGFDFRKAKDELSGDSTFTELAIYFLARKERQVSVSSIAVYYGHLKNHLIPFFGTKLIKDIDTYDLEDFIREREKDYSESIIDSMRILVTQIVNFAKTLGIQVNELEKVKIRSMIKKREVVIFNDEEVQRLKNSKTTFEKLMFNILFDTGVRIGEICGLKFGDIDMTRREININRQVQAIILPNNNHVNVGLPKSKAGIRTIPMTINLFLIFEEVEDILKSKKLDFEKLKDNFFMNYFFYNDLSKSTELSTITEEQVLIPRTLRYRFDSQLKKLNIPKKKVHSTRHTFATKLVKATNDYKACSKVLGHKNTEITINTYVHTNEEDIKNVIYNLN